MPSAWPEHTEVLAVDLDVRERSDDDAVAAMHRIGHLASNARVLVKIDSTLRGPVRGLIDGALAGFARDSAIIAPGFPEQGRTYKDGRLYVADNPGANLYDILGHNPRYCVLDDPRDAARAAHPGSLLVGSAGLARQLAPPHAAATVEWAAGDGPVLVVAGSPTSVTRQQLECLPAATDLVVFATPQAETRDAGEAAAALAERVAEWAQVRTPRAVVLTGGATARAVAHRLGSTSLRILGELQPGIPLARLEDGIWHGIPAVTKAGGFGTPQTLLDVARALGVSSS
jgi:D-threonate/D-erythronate kinase